MFNVIDLGEFGTYALTKTIIWAPKLPKLYIFKNIEYEDNDEIMCVKFKETKNDVVYYSVATDWKETHSILKQKISLKKAFSKKPIYRFTFSKIGDEWSVTKVRKLPEECLLPLKVRRP